MRYKNILITSGSSEEMSELTALITGANKGIGLALTKQLSALKFKIFAVCRNTSTELNSVDLNQGCIVENIDLSDPICNLDPLKVAVGSTSINWLINNAGILSVENFDETLDFDAVRKQFEVNAIGPIRITNVLKANLIHNSKVFIITSRMVTHSLTHSLTRSLTHSFTHSGKYRR